MTRYRYLRLLVWLRKLKWTPAVVLGFWVFAVAVMSFGGM